MPIPKWLVPPPIDEYTPDTGMPPGMVPISIFGEKPDEPYPSYEPSDFGPGPFPLADESIPRTTPEAIFKPFELEAQTLGRAIARPSMKGQTVLPEPPPQDVSQLMVEYERAGGFDALPPEIQEFASYVMAPSNLLSLAPEQALKAVPAIGKGLLAASRYPFPLMAEAGRIAKPIARELATGEAGFARVPKGKRVLPEAELLPMPRNPVTITSKPFHLGEGSWEASVTLDINDLTPRVQQAIERSSAGNGPFLRQQGDTLEVYFTHHTETAANTTIGNLQTNLRFKGHPQLPGGVASEGVAEAQLAKGQAQLPEGVAQGVAKEPWQMTRAEALSAPPSGYLQARRGGPEAGRYQLYYVGTRNLVEETAEQVFRTPTDAKRVYQGIKHKADVERALIEGKPVPPEVLADYPDLATRAAAQPIPEAIAPERPPVPPVSEVPPTAPPRGPTEPPGGVPPREPPFGAAPPPQDPAAKLTGLVKAAKPIRRETETLRTGERARRAAIGQKAFEGAEGREAFYQAKAKLGGELPKGQFAPPEAGLTPEDITGLFEQIKAKEPEFFDRISTSEALDTLLGGQLPTQSQIERLEKVFGPELAKAILSQRSWGQKAWEIFIDALNVPRTLQSSYDFSAPLRQGAILFAGHPVKGAKAFALMFKAAFSEKTALAIDTAIRRSKWADVREAAGLYLAPLSGVSSRLGGREEAFMSRLATKVPGVRVSERAYNTYLNKIRADVFDGVVAQWEQLGIKASEKDYSDLARFINLASGRGEIPRNLQGLAPALNGLFFSPRLQMSRLEMPFHVVRGTPLARKEMARNLVAFVGANATLGGLLAASRLATVELDPRSADFGKAKIGNTRIDLWAGYQQYARLVATLATGERKSAKGNIYSVPRGELFMRGVQSKFSPIAGLVTDVLRGQTYMGDELKMEPATIIDQAYNRLAPLFAQDLIDAIRDSGLVGGFLAAPGLFGAGVQTYGASPLEKLQQQVSGGRWDELTPAERKVLERQNPELRALIGETYAKEAGLGQDYAERKSRQVALEDIRDKELLDIAQATQRTGLGENYLKRRGDVMQDYYARTSENWEKYPSMESTDVNEKAFSEYMGVPLEYDAKTNEYGFAEQEAQQKAILAGFTPEQRAYIEKEKKLWPERFPSEVAQLERRYQEDKPLLTKYYGVADTLWDANPRAKAQRDRAATQSNPQVRAAIRAATPLIAAIEKQITLKRDAMRRSDPKLEKAVLFWTKTTTPIQLKRAG